MSAGPTEETTHANLLILLEEAKLRLELPSLVLRVLDLSPNLARQALVDWSQGSRPVEEIAAGLRQILQETP